MLAQPQDFLADTVRATLARCWPRPAAATVAAAMDEVFRLAEGCWEARRTGVGYLSGSPASACAPGCGWCCHQQVGVSVPEAVAIARHVGALPRAERDALAERVGAADRRTRGLTTHGRARARIACAFLGADGRCLIYAVRPLRCRGLHSIDAGFCADCHSDIDSMRAKLESGLLAPVFLDVPAQLFDSALAGVLAALRAHAPKAVVALELHAALHALFADPRLGERWLAGRAPDPALHLRPDAGKG
ncbi:MAG: YkgJ family cysteine cluster protein [Magnetospirillum sp.]|nr:YkgJ family cysteine cluster protein [Magnetospirillum sp.]